MKEIAARIRRKREGMSLSQQALGVALGVHESTVRRWERTGEVQKRFRAPLAVALQSSEGEIFGLAVSPPAAQQRDAERTPAQEAVLEIHRYLVDSGVDAEFNAMALAVLFATGKVERKDIERLGRVLNPALRGRKKAQ